MNNKNEEIIIMEEEISAPTEPDQSSMTPMPGASASLAADVKKSFFKKISKKTYLIIAAIIIVITLAAYLAYHYKGLIIAATIDGEPISRLKVIKTLEKVSGKDALDSLITQKLIMAEAKKQGITIGDDEVNKEIQKIEEQLKSQGQTLDNALSLQRMTLDDLKEQIVIQKELEKMLSNQTQVTDEEIEKYMKVSGVTIPKEQEENYKTQAKNQLAQQKLSTASQALISSLRSQAKIKYFVNY